MKGWRLPLVRRPDPALTCDEVVAIYDILAERLGCIQDEMDRRLVSESVIRERIYIEDALPKFREVMESMGYPRMNQKAQS